MSSFLDEIEPLKQSALGELKAAPDLAALEQAKVTYLGAHGKFTALLKQLGSLAKEERPVAGKLINDAKMQLENHAITGAAEAVPMAPAPLYAFRDGDVSPAGDGPIPRPDESGCFLEPSP